MSITSVIPVCEKSSRQNETVSLPCQLGHIKKAERGSVIQRQNLRTSEKRFKELEPARMAYREYMPED